MINQAYDMIIEDESQHPVGINAITANTDPLAMQLIVDSLTKVRDRFCNVSTVI